MKIKFDFKTFRISFILAVIVHIIVLYLWDLFFHGQGTFNFGFSFAVALALAISIALSLQSIKD